MTPDQIDALKRGGHDPHEIKGKKSASKRDLFVDREGNISVKPKAGNGPGEPTGLNINDYF